ncbi:rho guanine nucleotide exchange factor 10 [Puma concolor]|uniref:Rho guanine nucleotide exchange factor 10 n=1 Tax=Puma concolor TaxID=9696 RepID=A0A6P6IKZ4_PUMCO|nr:rho guanine nucleotide exchange factor 10 [Puma concolor]
MWELGTGVHGSEEMALLGRTRPEGDVHPGMGPCSAFGLGQDVHVLTCNRGGCGFTRRCVPKNEVKYDRNNNEEDEGEQFDFDSGDEIPEADRPAAGAPAGGGGADAASGSGGEIGRGTDAEAPVEGPTLEVPTRVNPYSVIDITPFQEEQPPPADPDAEEESASPPVPSGYSVPVPCGYAVPCNLPLLVPAYSSPVVIRAASLEEEETQEVAEDSPFNSLSSEDPANSDERAPKEDSALARWAADPANTAWMENPEEAIYDDVPRENSDSEPDEMIYDDVENGDEGGNSSLEYGWSSSEFESYEEQSDSECKNGVPRSFLRSNHRKQLSHDLTRLKEHYERTMRALMASTVAATEIQQLKQKHELKMQKLMKAAKEGTKDGLEKTKAAVKRGRSLIRTKSFMAPDHRSCLEEEQNLFIDVDCRHPEAILTPMPEGLSQQQVVRRYILGSVVDSEKNYVDALKRILERYEKPLSEMEPKILSERKLKTVFYRVKELLQCHGMFQIALASRVAEWDSVETIGDVFVASFSKSMVLDAYSEYVNNFSTAVAILKKTCATKPAFLEFLKQCQESSPDRITLYSLMMKPIQRFPQFILLLQDMLKNTSKGHPDRLPLQMALTELETLAEKLNERKRDADQRCEIKHVAKAINERYLNKLLSSGNRYLVRSDDMIETVYNDRGEIMKTKERRIFMLSDVLVCATVSTRTSDSSTMSTSQRYLLKWSVPLGHVEVIEYGNNEGAGENRCPPVYPPESLAVVANAKPNQVYVGPGQLYQDLQNLLHDLNVIGQISQLIGNLKGNYQNLNQSVAHDWTSGLQRLILKKEEEIRAADCCRLQLQLPGKQDKSGRPTFFTAVFNTFTPAIKESWTNNLKMAKLALASLGRGAVLFMVLCCLLRHHNGCLRGHVDVSSREKQIECAAYNPEPCVNNEVQPDSSSTAHGFLWMTGRMRHLGAGHLAELIDHLVMPHTVTATSRAVCAGHAPGGRAGVVHTPGSATVLSCLVEMVLVELWTPSTKYGSWSPEPQTVIKLGVLPVRSLVMTEDTLWAASGGQVFTISAETHTIENQLDAHQEEGMVVSHMVVAGVGIWIAFTSGSTLRLFHTETLKHLQDINIATPVHHMLPGHQRLSVTSLLVCHGLLMVGTSLGFVVALPVPRLQGIPKVTDHKPEKACVSGFRIFQFRNLPCMLPSRGRRVRRAKASSVLVVCGGQGHRRVSRKARPQRPEELAASIMVWQIPLLNA